jgi:hypothetical protein
MEFYLICYIPIGLNHLPCLPVRVAQGKAPTFPAVFKELVALLPQSREPLFAVPTDEERPHACVLGRLGLQRACLPSGFPECPGNPMQKYK